jgi:hypothetical protein
MSAQMETPATSDSAEAFEAKETAKALPWGWVALAAGLVLWGLYYAYAYTPMFGGWSQAAELEQAGGGASTAATIFFTVAAAIGVVVIAAVAGSKKK